MEKKLSNQKIEILAMLEESLEDFQGQMYRAIPSVTSTYSEENPIYDFEFLISLSEVSEKVRVALEKLRRLK